VSKGKKAYVVCRLERESYGKAKFVIRCLLLSKSDKALAVGRFGELESGRIKSITKEGVEWFRENGYMLEMDYRDWLMAQREFGVREAMVLDL